MGNKERKFYKCLSAAELNKSYKIEISGDLYFRFKMISQIMDVPLNEVFFGISCMGLERFEEEFKFSFDLKPFYSKGKK